MEPPKLPQPPLRPAAPPVQPGEVPQRIDSALLLRGANELLIDHHGVLYRLRQTALGKLILTK